MKSRVDENKELLETCVEYLEQLSKDIPVEKSSLSIIASSLVDISKSLAVIADAMSKEETDDPDSVI